MAQFFALASGVARVLGTMSKVAVVGTAAAGLFNFGMAAVTVAAVVAGATVIEVVVKAIDEKLDEEKEVEGESRRDSAIKII